VRLALCALAWAAGAACAQVPPSSAPQVGQVSKDSVWVPTPERLIRRMLQLADITREDFVIDLGSGDGRIPIHAAKHFGARAAGVELETNLVKLAREDAAAQGVSALVQFVQQDLYEADLSKATIITLYISPGVMQKLTPKLAALRPGTRIVSHQFVLDGWEADESVVVEGRNGYLWVVPEQVSGDWTVRSGSDRFRMRIEQTRQKLTTRGERGGKPVNVIGARLRGTEISFSSFDLDGNARQFLGRIDGSRMSGSSSGYGIEARPWSAQRD
jgi:precorrin-6B methylase 2